MSADEADCRQISPGIKEWSSNAHFEFSRDNVIDLPLRVITRPPHPAHLYVKAAETDTYVQASLVDDHGKEYYWASTGIFSTAPAKEHDKEHVLALVKLIEEGHDSVDVATAILDAGWQAPEPPEYEE